MDVYELLAIMGLAVLISTVSLVILALSDLLQALALTLRHSG